MTTRARGWRWLLLPLLGLASAVIATATPGEPRPDPDVAVDTAAPVVSPALRQRPDDLDAGVAAAGQRIFDATLARLPAAWRAALPTPLSLVWSDVLPAQVQGHARGSTIQIDRRLLTGWIANPDAAHARPLQAALVHELAHLLDRSPRGGLSRDPRLLDLAGWQVRPWHRGRGGNDFVDRSPDRYELHSPAEFVAVNLEHAVLDPDYACRRPALARWFAARLALPLPQPACAGELPFLQADDVDGAASLLALDPERVYAVDYLLAEGNDQLMSHWGHSMLRLVICAPGRPRGPDCRKDLQYHRVLSFRAFVGDLQLSSWRGLTGAYPSRLFLLPLDQVIDDYTGVELRGLSSLPLRLQRDEIAALLERAATVHWSYDGHYFFLGNNCAVETWRLLHDAVPRLARARLSGIAPDHLQRRLQRAGIGDAAVLQDRVQAERDGYYFASAEARYQAMFAVLRGALPLPQRTLRQWLDAPPPARGAWIAQADLRSAAAMLLLEQAAQRRIELQVRDTIKRRLLRGGAASADQRAAAQALLDQAGVLARPAALLDGAPGYGLPQPAELAVAGERATVRGQRLKQDWQVLREQARAQLPATQRDALAQGEANLAAIGARLRALQAAQGVALPLR